MRNRKRVLIVAAAATLAVSTVLFHATENERQQRALKEMEEKYQREAKEHFLNGYLFSLNGITIATMSDDWNVTDEGIKKALSMGEFTLENEKKLLDWQVQLMEDLVNDPIM